MKTVPPSAPSLRQAAQRLGLSIGTAVNHSALADDPSYREVLAREFSVLTPENEMKWGALSQARGQYDFSRADALVDFASRQQLLIHGHTFVWHLQNPAWLEQGAYPRAQMLAILEEHVRALTSRYKGKIPVWDVVNEAVADKDGVLRPTRWLERIGDDYIEQAFRIAHAADPAPRLLYNDYGIDNLGQKSDAVYGLLRQLRAKGVPVHGIGFQMHVRLDEVQLDSFAANLRRFAQLGLELYITELDVRLKLPLNDAQLAAQAAAYAGILRCALQEPALKYFQTWGFSDRHSWVPKWSKGEYGAALLFDENYKPKAAYTALLKTLAEGQR